MFAPLRFIAPLAAAAALLLARSASAASPESLTVPDAEPAKAIDNDRPFRHGFTMELGLGIADTYLSPEGSSAHDSKIGLAPLSMSLGGFVNPDLAILFRVAGTSYFARNGAGKESQFVNGFYGVHVQYWVNDYVMVSGGPGFTLLGENPYFGSHSSEAGYGASFRVAVAPLATKHHSLRIAAEVFPSKYESGFVFGSALNLEWQYY